VKQKHGFIAIQFRMRGPGPAAERGIDEASEFIDILEREAVCCDWQDDLKTPQEFAT
jgi:hypothetical protein